MHCSTRFSHTARGVRSMARDFGTTAARHHRGRVEGSGHMLANYLK